MKDVYDFINENRDEILAVLPSYVENDDEELRLWVLNDESLYQWAIETGYEV